MTGLTVLVVLNLLLVAAYASCYAECDTGFKSPNFDDCLPFKRMDDYCNVVQKCGTGLECVKNVCTRTADWLIPKNAMRYTQAAAVAYIPTGSKIVNSYTNGSLVWNVDGDPRTREECFPGGVCVTMPIIADVETGPLTHLSFGARFKGKLEAGDIPTSVTHLKFEKSYEMINAMEAVAVARPTHLVLGNVTHTLEPGDIPNSTTHLEIWHVQPGLGDFLNPGVFPSSLKSLKLHGWLENKGYSSVFWNFEYPLEVLLSELNDLEELEVATMELSNLKGLPNSLKSLTLLLASDEEFTQDIVPNGVERLIFKSDLEASLRGPIPVGAIPSSVKYLDLQVGSDLKLSPGFIPEGVTELVIRSGKVDEGVLQVGSLPSTVKKVNLLEAGPLQQPLLPGVIPDGTEELQIGLDGEDGAQVLIQGSLPQSLTHLTASIRYQGKVMVDGVSVLPPFLEYFELSPNFNCDSNVQLPKLPDTLRTLILNSLEFNSPMEDILPAGLQHLTIKSKIFSQPLSLPPSLKTLHMGSMHDTSVYLTFPLVLETLSLSELSMQLQPGAIPLSVTRLELHDVDQNNFTDIIPASVTHLRLQAPCQLQPGAIPLSVTRLELHNFHPDAITQGFIPASVVELSYSIYGAGYPEGVEQLTFAIPEGVEQLTLRIRARAEDVTFELAQGYLPESLKRLVYHYDKSIEVGVLPDGLEELYLGEEFGANEGCITRATCTTLPDGPLPSSLKILTIAGVMQTNPVFKFNVMNIPTTTSFFSADYDKCCTGYDDDDDDLDDADECFDGCIPGEDCPPCCADSCGGDDAADEDDEDDNDDEDDVDGAADCFDGCIPDEDCPPCCADSCGGDDAADCFDGCIPDDDCPPCCADSCGGADAEEEEDADDR